jgi:hypothetical protein
MASGLIFYLIEACGYKDTFHLANMFLYRGHVSSAIRNYEKGAENGDSKSMYALAIIYENGMGVSIDHVQYCSWMKKAALSGHRGALGECYIDGNGFQKDIVQGFNILKEYAEKCNESFVQGSVGGYYLRGEIIQKDLNEAKRWFKLSSNNFNPYSRQILDNL